MIREMAYRDIENVNTLLRDSFGDLYTEMNIDIIGRVKYMKVGYLLEKVLSLFVKNYEKSLEFYVYEEKGSIMGAVRITVHARGIFALATIAVDKAARRTGVGHALVDFLLTLCRKRGGKSIVATIEMRNTPSLHLAQKMGFTIYNEYYILTLTPATYRDREVRGWRRLKKGDFPRVNQLEREVMDAFTLGVEGEMQPPSLLSRAVRLSRGLLFGEEVCEYVLERGGEVKAYARVDHLLDGSSSLVVLFSRGEEYTLLKDCAENVMYHHGREKMRAITTKEQDREREILKELGFKDYSSHYAIYRKVESSQ